MARHLAVTTQIPKETAASPRYELLRALGTGGVGSVYLARDRETNERVALKKLSHVTPASVLQGMSAQRPERDICAYSPELVDGGA